MGRRLRFTGFIIDCSGNEVQIIPDPEKLEGIKEFKPPQDLTELRAFLGCIQQFGDWFPNLNLQHEKISVLRKKDVEFLCTEKHQEEFDELKKKMTDPLILSPFKVGLWTLLYIDTS